MIGLDSNVLVRFLVEDDAVQHARARALLERVVREDGRLFVSHLVVCEATWVFLRSYRLSRKAVVAAFADLLRSPHVVFEEPAALHRSLAAFARSKGDLADYLIRERASAVGCEFVATFDRDLLVDKGFREP